jgi:LmbE family N-acetylglucosaminyl deacetylase
MSRSAGSNCSVLRIAEITCAVAPDLTGLLGRTLILVAHPDDETACAGLLHRATHATVLFCTDGAPTQNHFWSRYSSRQQYAATRKTEAMRALAMVGKTPPQFLQDPQSHELFRDQQLYEAVARSYSSLLEKFEDSHLDAIVAPAYEGGHPDHDTCSFLAHLLGARLAVPVWETPLYHRTPNGELVHQRFLQPNGTEMTLHLTSAEIETRSAMLSAYVSQPDASEFVNAGVELYRQQPSYDFSLPPHPGKTNYELWCWPMTSSMLCKAFQSCLDGLQSQPAPKAHMDEPAKERMLMIADET